MTNNKHRSGFVSIIGRPNVGKSTLINSFMKEKLSMNEINLSLVNIDMNYIDLPEKIKKVKLKKISDDFSYKKMFAEKIINEIPFPTPLEVICSPSHIKNTVPVSKVTVVTNLKYMPGSNTMP